MSAIAVHSAMHTIAALPARVPHQAQQVCVVRHALTVEFWERSLCCRKSRSALHACTLQRFPAACTLRVRRLTLPRPPQDFDRLWWLSVLAAVMSFTYSFIGLGMSIAGTARARPLSSWCTCQHCHAGPVTGLPVIRGGT